MLKGLVLCFGLMTFLMLGACSDAVPQVSLLNAPKDLGPGVTPTPTPGLQNPVPSTQFAETGITGAQVLKTAEGYTGQFKIHGGEALSTAETADHYKLNVR
jgi:hypothetical protein